MWIQTGVMVRKRLSGVMTSVTLTFDLWPWPFAWTSLLSMAITPENFVMIRWQQHGEKGVKDGQTDGRTDRRTDRLRAAWTQLKNKLKQIRIRIFMCCCAPNEASAMHKLDESMACRHLKSPRSLSGRSLHLTLVTKWSRSHMTLKIQISMSWPRSNPLSHLRPRVQIDMFAFCFVAIRPLLVEI